jgi:hypothetical protein
MCHIRACYRQCWVVLWIFKWTAGRVEQPITDHFGKSFSILLHFKWFKML